SYAPHFESQAVVFAFLSAPASQGSWLISPACSAVLVGAHYREPDHDDKGFLAKTVRPLIFYPQTIKTTSLVPVTPTFCSIPAGAHLYS
ncbi:hypothetical protein, partial [Aeromonas bivalvium]|uniref:hypothetical protein n=1 Tax=Aeromonas bivalvium TaxID=440079 RepID=UPI0038D0FB99